MRVWLTELVNIPWLRLSIRAKGRVLVSIPLIAIFSVLGVLAYLQREQEASQQWVRHTQQVQVKSQELSTLLIDGQSSVRGHALTGEARFLAPYERAQARVVPVLGELGRLVADDPEQSRRVQELDPLVRQRMVQLKAVRDLVGERESRHLAVVGSAQVVAEVLQGKVVMDAVRRKIAELQSYEDQLLEQRLVRLRDQRHIVWTILPLSALLALAGGWLAASLFASGIATRLGVLAGNARRLAYRQPMLPPIAGADEINALDRELHRTADLVLENEARIQQLNRDLQTKVQELASTNQDLEAFTYSVAHDLRTPLRHIHGFVSLMVEDYGAQLAGEARTYLEHISRGTANMGRLIDDLLNLSRVGRQQVVPQAVGLGKLVAEVRDQVAQEADGRAVRFRIGELPFVECDAGLMRQVFHNLLANALKFTRPRSEALIEVGVEQRRGTTVLFVRDNGVGFNMKYADKLFGVFQRLHRQEDFEGTGVGLATVQRIVRKHGGDIWAEARLDRGATFYFTLSGLGEPQHTLAARPPAPGNLPERSTYDTYGV
jgi:signal transduction histidine kinase